MPSVLLSPPALVVVLVVVLVLLLVVRHRRTLRPSRPAAVPTPTPSTTPLLEAGLDADLAEPVDAALPESEKVRTLRLQVATLTEVLRELTEGLAPEPAPFAVERSASAGEAPPVASSVLTALLQTDPQPVGDPVVDIVVDHELVAHPEPVADLAAVDPTADAYVDLSRARAAAGDLREAALAQWAADLRVLAPLLQGRTQELYDGLTTLAPADAVSAVTAARAVAAGLIGADVPLDTLLADAGHLAASPVAGAPAYTLDDVAHDVLPDAVVDALTAALLDSAARGDDPARVSVGLRCDLVAHVASGRPQDGSAALVRDLLEPHERSAYDVRLAG